MASQFFKNYRMSQSSQIKLEDVEEYELTYSTVRGLIESDLSANKNFGKGKRQK